MKLLALAFLVALSVAPAIAAETSIEMLNSKDGENLVFSQKFTKVAKGDIVTFKAAKPGHNAEFVPGWISARGQQVARLVRQGRFIHVQHARPVSRPMRPTPWDGHGCAGGGRCSHEPRPDQAALATWQGQGGGR
jgi:plastocyanin